MRILLLMACLGLACAALPAYAAENPQAAVKPVPNPVAVVVDVQKVLDELLAAKSVQKQVEGQSTKFQAQIGKEETELSHAEQDLDKARTDLTPDAYSDREQQLRQRFLVVERHVQARRRVLDQGMTDAMATVRSTLLQVVNSVAHEHGANLVLIKQQVLWADKALDVTDEVLGRLNATLSEVTVKVSEDKVEEPPK